MRLRGYALTKRKVLVTLASLLALIFLLQFTSFQTIDSLQDPQSPVNDIVPPPSSRQIVTEGRIIQTVQYKAQQEEKVAEEEEDESPLNTTTPPCRVVEEINDSCVVKFSNNCTNLERRDAVKSAVAHAWRQYRKFAWGKDYLRPVSKDGEDGMFHLGQTIVDSIGTLHMMEFTEFTKDALNWISDNFLLFKGHNDVSFFETVVRYLGGLLEIYHLSGNKMFVEKARDLGVLLSQCFGNPTSIPFTRLDLTKRVCKLQGGCRKQQDCNVNTAEVATIQLELRELSIVTGDYMFFSMVNNTSNKMLSSAPQNGMVPQHINMYSGEFVGHNYHLGPGIDSYYEYILKQWIHSGKKADRFKEEYTKAIYSISNILITKTRNFTIVGKQGDFFDDEMEHLSCFVPGMLALGHYHGLPKWHLTLSQHIMRSCYYMAISQPTGLAPESVYFDYDQLYPINSMNVLRPEIVESLFILYRVTGDETYRDWGWEIFKGFERSSRMCTGYSGVLDTQSTNHIYRVDRMESGFIAGTLKYLYLLFSDKEHYSLDYWVFNSHGHLLPISPSSFKSVYY